MAEPASDQRLAALLKRWEDDRSSAAFVPLAEEYRRLGRLNEALAVLEQGMTIAPNYLSAQVALGRCRLDLGDFTGAAQSFERVVRQDPTQLVANKLLVEAYLRAGRSTDAGRRLDVYALLNGRDPEIELLRQRIHSAPEPVTTPDAPPPSAAEPAPSEPEPMPAPALAPEPSLLSPPPARSAPASVSGDVFRLPPLVAPAPDLAAATPEPRTRTRPGSGTLFEGLGTAEARRRYVASLLGGEVFGVAGAAPATAAHRAAPASLEAMAAKIEIGAAAVAEASPLVAPALVARAETLVEPAPEAEEPLEAPVPMPSGPVEPTATLGEIYLRQGHREEAETIFQRVLESHPESSAALEGLESARRQGDGSGSKGRPAGLTARKVAALQGYLKRLRGGAERHVP